MRTCGSMPSGSPPPSSIDVFKELLNQCEGGDGALQTFTKQLESWDGEAQMDAEIVDLLMHVGSHITGGLELNCFQLGFDPKKKALGIQCLTCNNGKFLAIGKARGSLFNSFKAQHLKGAGSGKHETARTTLTMDVERHLMSSQSTQPSESSREQTRQHLLRARAEGRSGLERLPAASLAPIGAEPLGPTTRSSTMRSLEPTLPETVQDRLNSQIGSGAFVVNADQTYAACQHCSRFYQTLIQLSNPNWLQNALTHFETHTRHTRGMSISTVCRLAQHVSVMFQA